ncbi:hypothetical protein [Deinococcus arcticus]|uniref:hypothetical protein n=1 Tax=Deinococcus arcticus TaxID=2136176 RepID=UPI000D17E0E0|nr:hypothetical protein [Deinococcus arcticus]
MTAQLSTDERGRVHFGRLTVRPSPVDRALSALGEAVPRLEVALGFPVSVTAQPMPDGTLTAEVIMPDAHYAFDQAMEICATLQDAVRPFSVDLNVEVDSDFQHGE